jgi:hypothetical protein
MGYDVRVEHRVRGELAVVRRRATPREFGRVVPEACGLVWGVIRSQKITGAGRHVAVYLDGEGNLEVGVELESPFAGHGEVIGSSTPSGVVATATHFGPYDRLHEVHTAIRQWCRDCGYELAGPVWEIYDHWRDEWNSNPAEIRTDVCYLLDPNAGALLEQRAE